MLLEGIKRSEYAARRKQVLRKLQRSVACVFSGSGEPPLLGRWEADPNFFYLTGLKYESDAAVLFQPKAEDPKKRCILFLKPLNRERERWDGYRSEINSQLRKESGFDTVLRMPNLPALLTAAGRRFRSFACLHPFSVYNAPVSKDLAVFRKVSERVPGITIEDRTDIVSGMRSMKSKAELALIRKAIAATADGYEAVFGIMKPGVSEKELDHAITNAYQKAGARRHAFNPIVGSGMNGTVLHYMDNNNITGEGELVVIDSGADVLGYAADVTRTLPVSGRFTREQKRLYNVVLDAQNAAIKKVRPGARLADIQGAARDVIDKAGLGDAFIHGIGHQLGIDVHDITPDGRFKKGMVTTIEPGIYLPDKGIGIRIEDDVLVTENGRRSLTAMIPRTVEEIESAMRKARRKKS